MSQESADHYFNESHDTEERFTSDWHQIHEIISLEKS